MLTNNTKLYFCGNLIFQLKDIRFFKSNITKFTNLFNLKYYKNTAFYIDKAFFTTSATFLCYMSIYLIVLMLRNLVYILMGLLNIKEDKFKELKPNN